MTNTDPNLACPNCTYELTALPLSNNKTTCPECGYHVTPYPVDTYYTNTQLHTQLTTRVLLPTLAPLPILGSMYFFEPMAVAVVLVTIAFPFFALFCVIYQLISSLEHNKRSPKKMTNTVIFLWVLLYSIPGPLSYYFLFQSVLSRIL